MGLFIINFIIFYRYINGITKRYSEFHNRHDLLTGSAKDALEYGINILSKYVILCLDTSLALTFLWRPPKIPLLRQYRSKLRINSYLRSEASTIAKVNTVFSGCQPCNWTTFRRPSLLPSSGANVTQIMRTEMVPEMSVIFSWMTRLIAREHFI
jgi:hypothetical protein